MEVPSILNCTVEECRRRYRKALRQERVEMFTRPLKQFLPQVADDLLALIMSAGLFVVLSACAVMILGG